MVAAPFAEVIVIRYTYRPDMLNNEHKASIKSRKFKSSGTIFAASDWYARIIFRERFMQPPKMKILFSEWHVNTGYKDFFTFGNYTYEEAILILGVDKCFWAYFNRNQTDRRAEGSCNLDMSICSCCLQDKCLDIAKKAKELRYPKRAYKS